MGRRTSPPRRPTGIRIQSATQLHQTARVKAWFRKSLNRCSADRYRSKEHANSDTRAIERRCPATVQRLHEPVCTLAGSLFERKRSALHLLSDFRNQAL